MAGVLAGHSEPVSGPRRQAGCQAAGRDPLRLRDALTDIQSRVVKTHLSGGGGGRGQACDLERFGDMNTNTTGSASVRRNQPGSEK